jgi:hypothetical protein
MDGDNNDENRSERARRWRNVVLALVLGALVVLFFIMTLVRLKGHVIDFSQ